jgi:hypothetical protein
MRQCVLREKLALQDLEVRAPFLDDPKFARDEKHLVVAHGSTGVLEYSTEFRLSGELNTRFLKQFAPKRLCRRLADFDPASWKVPARDEAGANQKHLSVNVQDGAADPEGHCLERRSVELHGPPQGLVSVCTELHPFTCGAPLPRTQQQHDCVPLTR